MILAALLHLSLALAAPDAGPIVAPRVAADLIDRGAVVLHVGHGRRGYDRSHVPGAFYVDFHEALADDGDDEAEVPDAAAVAELLGRYGVTADTTLVLYGDAAGVFPARLYLALATYGLADQVHMIDGHLRGWIATGLPTESDAPPAPEPTVPDLRRPADGPIVTTADVEAAIAGGDVTLLDVRPADQFSGAKRGPNVARAGRVPGAVNVPWQTLLTGVNPPWLRDADTLRAELDAAGVPIDRPVIVYDAHGLQAALAWVVLLDLGYDARLYDAGYAAWARRESE